LHELLVPHGSLTAATMAREPSFQALLSGCGAMSCLPVEITCTEYSAQVLTSNASTYSRNWCPL
jgi:hypothetical protein